MFSGPGVKLETVYLLNDPNFSRTIFFPASTIKGERLLGSKPKPGLNFFTIMAKTFLVDTVSLGVKEGVFILC